MQSAPSAVHPIYKPYVEGFGLGDFFRQSDLMMPEALLLRFKPVNMDVLPMHIAVLVAFPPMLWALVRKPDLALAGSVALYLLARSNGWTLVSQQPDFGAATSWRGERTLSQSAHRPCAGRHAQRRAPMDSKPAAESAVYQLSLAALLGRKVQCSAHAAVRAISAHVQVGR